jgi:hypothetical protein
MASLTLGSPRISAVLGNAAEPRHSQRRWPPNRSHAALEIFATSGIVGLRVLDTRKFGYVVVREAITFRTGTNDDDFTRNLIRFVSEERLALAVERPAAVLAISGLPTS